jgi:hypothetical protein
MCAGLGRHGSAATPRLASLCFRRSARDWPGCSNGAPDAGTPEIEAARGHKQLGRPSAYSAERTFRPAARLPLGTAHAETAKQMPRMCDACHRRCTQTATRANNLPASPQETTTATSTTSWISQPTANTTSKVFPTQASTCTVAQDRYTWAAPRSLRFRNLSSLPPGSPNRQSNTEDPDLDLAGICMRVRLINPSYELQTHQPLNPTSTRMHLQY